MEVEIHEKEGGTEIRVHTDERVAVAVKTGEGERIYLPDAEGSDSSYYVEKPESLRETEYGYAVFHPGSVEDVEVIS
ncbi:MAG: hypothetical protein ABEJ66_03215 [Candidatus Nanohaloarchaea archaeon]